MLRLSPPPKPRRGRGGAGWSTLRRARHALKGIAGAEALYARMKEIELEAERGAHQRLSVLAPPPDPGVSAAARLQAARANLLLYVGAAAATAAPIIAAVDAMTP